MLPPKVEPAVNVFRAPKVGRESFIVLSHQWVAHSTHFTTRTRVCPGEDRCPLCAESVIPRWLAWIAAGRPGRTEVGLLELTSFTADQLAAKGDDAGSLFGVVFTLERDRAKWPRCVDFGRHNPDQKWRVDTAWVQRQLRRVLSLPDTDGWKDAAAALLRHDIQHGQLQSCAH